MKIPRLKGLAASAVALATLALPLQAMAAPHGRFGGDRPDQARCSQMQRAEGHYKWLARQYPQLAQWLLQCGGTAGPLTPGTPGYPGTSGSPGTSGAPQSSSNQLLAFTDLGGYGWASNDINLLQSMGIMRGVGQSRFAPAGVLSRVQFAALLQRVFHLSVPSTPVTFVDVPTSYWGYDAVEAAAPYMGEFNTPGGLAFEPSLPVLRIDVAATIGKVEVTEGMAQLPSTTTAQSIWAGFSDGSLVPPGLSQYAAVAVQSGIMKGFPNGSFGVDDTLNRAEAAVLLVRVLEGTETMPGGTSTITSTSSVQGTFESTSGTTIDVNVAGVADVFTLSASGYTVTLNGQTSSIGNLTAGDTVTVALNASGQVIAIEATGNSTGVTTMSGTVVSFNGTTLLVSVNGVTLQLSVAPGVTVSATTGEAVTISLNASGQVVAVTGTTTGSATGSVVAVNSSASTIELDVNGAYETYTVVAGATITLNNQSVGLANLAAGETATVTLDSAGQVTSIVASGSATSSSETGTVVAVNTSANTIELDVNGSDVTFTLAAGATITLNGQSVGLGNLAAGETATVTLDSAGQVTSIAASGSATSSSETGTVVGVNTSASTIALDVNGSEVTFTVAAGATITLNNQTVSLGSIATGDTATVTIDAMDQVTAITASTPAVTQTTTGYIVAISATSVEVAVYGNSGPAEETYTVAAGAQVTLNGSASTAGSLPLGDQSSLGLDSSGAVVEIAATTPSGQLAGQLVGISATEASLLVNGSLQTVALGNAAVAYSGGNLIAVGSLPLDQNVTIDPSAMNGSALLVR